MTVDVLTMLSAGVNGNASRQNLQCSGRASILPVYMCDLDH